MTRRTRTVANADAYVGEQDDDQYPRSAHVLYRATARRAGAGEAQ